jgi:type IV pilus assembly protein PilB
LKQILDSPAGMILFAGPTGSGKTTSMYACLNYLNHDSLKICTIESPVEFSIEGVAQCQLRSTDKNQIHERVRSIMHQDPDVIVLGEINDTDSAQAAMQAALTGHKVFSTIHTEDSFGGLMRLMEMGLRTFLLSSTGIASIAQRLVRKICMHCKEQLSPDRELLKGFNLEGLDPDSLDFYRGSGCLSCHHTGFFGRTGLFEILIMDDEIRIAFLESKNAAHIRQLTQTSRQFLSLREAGFIKALQGETTMDEVISILSYSEMQAFSTLHLSDAQIKYWMGVDSPEVSTT